MNGPSLAIVVVSYNSGERLEKAFSSLFQNIKAYPGEVQVGLVENGDPASTRALAEKYMEQGLRFLPAPSNLGYGGAANFGWKNLDGEVWLVLNPDMSFPEGWLQKFTAPFLLDPQIGIAGCKLLYEDGRVQHAGGILQRGAALIETFGQGEDDDGRWDWQGEAEFVTGAALAIRRKTAEALGGFDTGFFPGYFEDVDLCFRAHSAGWRVWYEGSAFAYHYEGSTFGRGQTYYRAFHHNRLRFVLKHYPAQRLFGEFIPAEKTRLMQVTAREDRLAAGEIYSSLCLLTKKNPSNPKIMESIGPLQEEPDNNYNISVRARLAERLAEVKKSWLVEEKPFHSRLPFIAFLREKFNSLSTKWYVKSILVQQNDFNAAVARAVEDLGNIVSGQVAADDLETAALTYRLSALEEKLTRIEKLLENLNKGLEKR